MLLCRCVLLCTHLRDLVPRFRRHPFLDLGLESVCVCVCVCVRVCAGGAGGERGEGGETGQRGVRGEFSSLARKSFQVVARNLELSVLEVIAKETAEARPIIWLCSCCLSSRHCWLRCCTISQMEIESQTMQSDLVSITYLKLHDRNGAHQNI